MEFSNTSLNISANLPVWLIIVLCLLTFGFAFWSYRRPNPPVSGLTKTALILLRGFAICGAIIVLTQPFINLDRRIEEPAKIFVLMDNSASMSISQGDASRAETVKSLLNGTGFRQIYERYQLKFFTFGDSVKDGGQKLKELAENYKPEEIGTNISRAWTEALDMSEFEEPSAMLLISDGAHNNGPDPVRLARNAKYPIFTLGVGSSRQYQDLMITQILSNRIVYQNSKTPVEVEYRCISSGGESINLELRDSAGNIVGKKQILAEGDFFEGSETFEITLKNSGRQRYTAQITPIENELTTDNNRKSFYLNVLESKMKILIMAGPPDNSLGDLVRRLSGDEHVELIQRTTKRNGFYESDWLTENELLDLDAIILHHFPVRQTDNEKWREFLDFIEKNNLPVSFFDGEDVDYDSFKELESVLPISIASYRSRSMEGQFVPVQRHAILTDPEKVDFIDVWSKLPPLLFTPNKYNVSPEAKVIGEFISIENERSYPGLIVNETAGEKSITFLGHNSWRWGLASPGESGIYEPFLNRLVRWLSLRQTEKQVSVSFDKESYSNQEPVKYTVKVVDENYLPIDNAIVKSTISVNDEIGSESILESIGNGAYQESFQPWTKGEYEIEAAAEIDGVNIGSDRGKITVEPFNIELLDSRLHEKTLESIANFSGARYAHASDADSLLLSLDFTPIENEIRKDLKLWGNYWLLVAIIAFLAIEWFIRIRVGML